MSATVLARVVVWLALLPAVATGQAPAPPDPARYPTLASLSAWLRSDAKEAKNCSATAAMALSARAALDRTQSDASATDVIAQGLLSASKGQLDAGRARTLASGYVRIAQSFRPLSAEASGIGIAQLCRSAVERGDRPFGDAALLKRLVDDARACTSSGFAEKMSNYVPLECVVTVMAKRP
jgi:hypothetical protein